jgi:hypothetical protein
MSKALTNPKLFAATGILFVIASAFNLSSGATPIAPTTTLLTAPEAPAKGGATLPPDMVCTPWTPCSPQAN